MSVPHHKLLRLPVLRALLDGVSSIPDIHDHVVEYEELSSNDVNEKMPTTKKPKLLERIKWAARCLVNSGLAERPNPGNYRITNFGIKVLSQSEECANRFVSDIVELCTKQG